MPPIGFGASPLMAPGPVPPPVELGNVASTNSFSATAVSHGAYATPSFVPEEPAGSMGASPDALQQPVFVEIREESFASLPPAVLRASPDGATTSQLSERGREQLLTTPEGFNSTASSTGTLSENLRVAMDALNSSATSMQVVGDPLPLTAAQVDELLFGSGLFDFLKADDDVPLLAVVDNNTDAIPAGVECTPVVLTIANYPADAISATAESMVGVTISGDVSSDADRPALRPVRCKDYSSCF